ncbi:Uma2 family endonuclease [Pampinifervens florentissimum]|uniref:Uma2 family endonuclease n=1 Tax=Pampinifervens florentissimum TaxID=1632019 RepID=UPI0013B48939|nr:Uma2 family endonuclease [Hydrogenobacter sp. T-8]QID33204.1 Uma2 family endonuclease [Hydrogenobacter sp. T-8]
MIAEKVWTYEDYLSLDEEKRYEIIDGELFEMPAPSVRHQEISGRLYVKLFNYIVESSLGIVLYAPIDVVLSEKDVLQPDLVVVLKENLSIVQERGIFGVPDLVVEIVSASSYKRDTEDKKRLYANYGVKEYWLVLPELRLIEVLTLQEGEYRAFSFACERGKVCSKLADGLCIDLEEVFR